MGIIQFYYDKPGLEKSGISYRTFIRKKEYYAHRKGF